MYHISCYLTLKSFILKLKSKMQHVLILGCGRSGTSIFGELFQHLDAYTYHSEPPFKELIKWDYNKLLAVKVPREDAGLKPDAGLSFPLSVLMEHFAKPHQIFWQVRHPLDAIASLKVGISKNWGHHPQPKDWQQWLSQPLVKQCAHHWNYINTVGYSKVRDLVKITWFEDMLADPYQFALDLTKELGIDIETNRKALSTWAKRVQNTNNKHFIEAETSRPYSTKDHKVKVGRWKENLTKKEVDMVLPMIKKTAEEFGYDLP